MAKQATTVIEDFEPNVPPKKEPTMAEVMAMLVKLQAENQVLKTNLENATLSEVINRPHNPNVVDDELFPRMEAQPVARMNIKRVWIVLEDHPNLPRNGLMMGANGIHYLLRPGLRAHVPITLVDILRNAIEGKPVINPETLQVTGYQNVLRYPFRIVKAEAPDPSRRPSQTDYEADAA
jgi:hypothetical protein